MDRLINRFGAENVYRIEPVESDVPERSVQRVPALAPPQRDVLADHAAAAGAPFDATTAGDGDRTAA